MTAAAWERLKDAAGLVPRRETDRLVGRCPACGGEDRFIAALDDASGTVRAWCATGRESCSPGALSALLGVELPPTDDEAWSHTTTLQTGRTAPETGVPGNRFASRVLSRSGLAALPEPEPLIDDTLDRHTFALLAGYHGTGKSFIAMDWAACVATGTPWMGRGVRQGKVLYVVGEGAHGVHSRLAAWEEANGVAIPDERLHVYPEAVQITDSATKAAFLEFVEDQRYDLIVLDTLARCAVGLDENSAKDIGAFVSAVGQIQAASGGTVLVVHHTGKDKATVRGSSALEAAVDTAYAVEGDADRFKLKRTKRKDGPMHDEHTLRLAEVGSSCVVQAILDERAERMREGSGRLAAAWTAIRRAHWDTAASKTELARTIQEQLGVGRSTAYECVSALAAYGVLRNVGTEKAPRLVTRPEVARTLGLPEVEPFELRVPSQLKDDE